MSATEGDVIGNQAAADYLGISVNSWRPYVARGQAPPPVRREIRGGHALPVWRSEDLDDWRATRPGRGRRRTGRTTDIGKGR